jgi:hypothetical protein
MLSPDLRVDRILPSTVRDVNDSSYVIGDEKSYRRAALRPQCSAQLR